MIINTSYPTSRSIMLSINSFDGGLNLSHDNDLTSFNYATDLKNFAFKDGTLKSGLGLKSLALHLSNETLLNRDFLTIGNWLKVFHFYKYNKENKKREDKLVFIDFNYNVYYLNLYDQEKTLFSLRSIKFTSPPTAIRYRLNGEDVLIFSSETDNMTIWDGINNPYEVIDSPKISSMALHYERLFTTVDGEKNSIWFSDDLDPTNWSLSLEEAGFIELIDERGALEFVISFSDYIYIFREYGISRLTAFGNQSDFSVSNLFVSSSKIYTNSVCVCGDKILFLASDGLYKFDGVDTIKILNNINNGFINTNNSNCSACYFNGKYYLLCNFNNKNENTDFLSTILEIDTTTNKLTNIISNINAKSITAINCDTFSGVVVTAFDKQDNCYIPSILFNNGKLFEDNLQKEWISPISNLNEPGKYKILTSIRIESLTDIILTINHDNKEKNIAIKGKPTSQIIKTYLPLKNFCFKITSTQNVCEIKNLNFEFQKTERR